MFFDVGCRSWFALQIRPRRERLVETVLRHKGYDAFLPVRRNMVRKRTQDSPLFPGYVFCRADTGVVGPLVTTPGVVRIVGYGNQPAPIPDSEIENIRCVSASGKGYAHSYIECGQRIRIIDGPLRGTEGILIKEGEGARMVVSVSILQRSVAVAVNPEWICPSIA